MPFLTVYTNVELDNKAELAEKSAELIADVLHKPINYVVTNIIINSAMSFGGKSTQKGALVELLSIGFSNKDLLVSRLTDFLAEELNITSKSNINISLIDADSSKVASNGQTFG